MNRKALVVLSALGVCTSIFSYGILVGARKYPPYHALRAAYHGLAGGGAVDAARDDEVAARYRETDPQRLILLRSAGDVTQKRLNLVRLLWGSDALPDRQPQVERAISDKHYRELDNLLRIDKLTVEMEFGLSSVCYHFVPKQSNGQLLIYHQGHRGGFLLGREIINDFLRQGYAVIAMAMPLMGMNHKPVVRLKRFGRFKIQFHDQLKLLDLARGHPVRFFIEPVVVVTNYGVKQKYKTISIVGISGGGWTATLAAAVEPRIAFSYPVAGSLPIYLRSEELRNWGDYEQTAIEVYRVANYLELYVLASTGGAGGKRRHVQLLNRFDAVGFSGLGFRTYEKQVAESVRNCGGGKFEVLLDESHKDHKISSWAVAKILADLAEGHAER